ncbi:MAG: PAS domain-containing sensor histidine kinase [Mariniphaga sp.]
MQQHQTCRTPEQLTDAPASQNEERFRQLIKNSFDIIVLIDAEGIQKFVSESCESILGFQPMELINISVIDTMIHPDDREKARKALGDIIDKNGSGGIHYRHRHKNGNWVHLEAYGTNQLDNPVVQAIVLNVRDITHRIKIEQALRESEAHLEELNAGKDKIFSIIAHDLKTPFTSILGFSELLIEQVRERNFEGIESYAMGIQHSAKRTYDLLTNLLEWSYAQTGLMKFVPKEFDLVELIYNMRRLLENAARQKGIILFCDLPDNLWVNADKNMLSTVFRNLISNGIKFTHPGGGIKISALRTAEGVKVTVADNGVGISKEALGKLFDIQSTFSTPGTYKEMGTGIGLLLCREFIEKHGCQIGAESELGRGSTFWFTVPPAAETQSCS